MKINLDKDTRRKVTFSLLLVYVFAFLFWWTFLLLRQSNQHISDIIRYETLREQVDSGMPNASLSPEKIETIRQDFRRNQIMIITEGLVFFALLLLGMLYIRKSWLQEIRLNRQQNNFILSITHELKSPLSTIKLVAQTLFKRELPKVKKQTLLQSSLEETERLQNLVENILAAAKLEDGKYGIRKSKTQLKSLLDRIAQRYFDITDRLKYASNEDCQLLLNADKNALELVFVNLVDNALKYSDQGDVIMTYTCLNDIVEIRVKDEGPGISVDEVKHIFKKFYRSGDEHTRRANGTGLGLYIVDKIVKYHQGSIKLENPGEPGACFVVTLPILT